ncbi:MAG: hypothetical protein CM15mP74_20100 [Halieaceae bacterium]|nr:MAG: hypothetical protein CM15mP74_20100 [Halieaceae bacterium]
MSWGFLDVTVHDFVSVCPVSFSGAFRSLLRQTVSRGLQSLHSRRPNHLGLDISAWRSLFSSHFAKAERVICPTRYVARVIGEYFPGVSPEVLAHPEPAPECLRDMWSKRAPGSRCDRRRTVTDQGVDLVEAVIRLAESRELPVDFVVVGFTTRPLYNGCRAGVTGPYSRAELPTFSSENGRIVFVPASNSRDFQLHLVRVSRDGLPIVARSLGAFEERLENIARAHLLPADATAQATLDLIMAQHRPMTP